MLLYLHDHHPATQPPRMHPPARHCTPAASQPANHGPPACHLHATHMAPERFLLPGPPACHHMLATTCLPLHPGSHQRTTCIFSPLEPVQCAWYIYIYIYTCVCVCVCACMYTYIYIYMRRSRPRSILLNHTRSIHVASRSPMWSRSRRSTPTKCTGQSTCTKHPLRQTSRQGRLR